MQRQILANFDNEGLIVYQAFNPSIAKEAVRLGTFGKGFNLERMTWIKPSFGWMLYRSGYATKHNQERILKIKLSHDGFQAILSRGIPTTFEPVLFETELDWQLALRRGEVRYQWDPDRDLWLRRLERRALQLGIRGSIVRNYVNQWILGIEDVTELAHAIKAAIASKQKQLPLVPEEQCIKFLPRYNKLSDKLISYVLLSYLTKAGKMPALQIYKQLDAPVPIQVEKGYKTFNVQPFNLQLFLRGSKTLISKR